jgi:hypothetical protein
MKFSEVIAKMNYDKAKSEMSEKLNNAMDAIEILADTSAEYPELSVVNRGFYNYLISTLMDAHPLID